MGEKGSTYLVIKNLNPVRKASEYYKNTNLVKVDEGSLPSLSRKQTLKKISPVPKMKLHKLGTQEVTKTSFMSNESRGKKSPTSAEYLHLKHNFNMKDNAVISIKSLAKKGT